MSDSALSSKEDRIRELQTELEQLTGESVEEISEVLHEAEETVTEAAEGVQDEAGPAHETVAESAQEIEATVEETAQEAAEELGHPEEAERIADHLMSKLDERGLLQHTHHEPHEESHGTVGEPDVVAEPVAEAEHVAEPPAEPAAPDTAPEAGHFWYRPLSFKRRG